jgi:hypothetical protein
MTRIQKQRLSLLVLAGLLILVIGGGLLSYNSVTSLSRHAVERLATKQLGVKVSVDSLDIDPESESVLIEGLTINNPKGYKKGPAITIATIDIDARSLKRELLAFEDISVTGMNMRVEVDKAGTNLSTLRDQVAEHVAKQKPAKFKLVRVVIDHIVFTGTRVEPAMVRDAIARDLSPTVLPEIHLRGIGEVEQGIPAQQAVTQVLTYVINVALRAAADEGYLESLTPEQQRAIGAKLSLTDRMLEDAKAAINKAPSDVEKLKKSVNKTFKVNE